MERQRTCVDSELRPQSYVCAAGMLQTVTAHAWCVAALMHHGGRSRGSPDSGCCIRRDKAQSRARMKVSVDGWGTGGGRLPAPTIFSWFELSPRQPVEGAHLQQDDMGVVVLLHQEHPLHAAPQALLVIPAAGWCARRQAMQERESVLNGGLLRRANQGWQGLLLAAWAADALFALLSRFLASMQF